MAAIVVHGGAGSAGPVADREPRRAGVARAADAGWALLAAGGHAVDAVLAAVELLEDDPHFNAGVGSVLTVEGDVEMDASVMRGDTLAAGAVATVTGVRHPIRLAHAVLVEGREVFVAGPAALAFAARHAVAMCAPETLVTAAARRRWAARGASPGDTVGAVACDAAGHVAAATSTGGVAGKRRGRIGDSAVIGAGTYADDALGAGSATGPGEAIIRVCLVRGTLERIAGGSDPQMAADAALADLARRLGTTAGLVVVDARGNVGLAHTTESMPSAYRAGSMPATIVRG